MLVEDRCWWKIGVSGDVVVIFNQSFIYNIGDDERVRSLVVVNHCVVGSRGRSLGGSRVRSLGGFIVVLDDASDGFYHFEVLVKDRNFEGW